jgi:putative FmdB family regulatory protein
MPTYDYVCTSCQNAWEEVQRISEPPLETCPKCAKQTAKRQISGGNFILKGGGWYADLYSSSPKKNGAPSEGGGKSENGAAASSGGEKKTETATKSAPAPAKADPTPAK